MTLTPSSERARLGPQQRERNLARLARETFDVVVLGWDEERIAGEVGLDRGRVDAERRSQEQPDDEPADRIGRSVPDPYAAPAT